MSAVIVMIATLSGLIVGCHKADSGLNGSEQQMTNRLDEIAKKTGGDWNRLSPEDRKYLVDDISHGSEQSARMLLSVKGGHLKGTPGGPVKH